MNYQVQRKIRSSIDEVKNVVDDILINIQQDLNDKIIFNTKLILNELIINGVIHGNHKDASKYLYISVYIKNNCVVIEVSDEGLGIVYKHKSFGEYDFDCSGRGLMLVEGLSDKFRVSGNKVTCVQYLK